MDCGIWSNSIFNKGNNGSSLSIWHNQSRDVATTLNRTEVDDAFEVPLVYLMDAQNHALHSRDWKGVMRRYYAMPFGERYIWGVTAGILRNLYERVYGDQW